MRNFVFNFVIVQHVCHEFFFEVVDRDMCNSDSIPCVYKLDRAFPLSRRCINGRIPSVSARDFLSEAVIFSILWLFKNQFRLHGNMYLLCLSARLFLVSTIYLNFLNLIGPKLD